MAKAVEKKAEDTSSELVETYDELQLYGEYRFKIDGKGRMSLPAKFRKVLPNELVVMRELEDECLYVFRSPDYNRWVKNLFKERFGGYNDTSRTQSVLMRKVKRRAKTVDIDSSGRIMLPPDMRETVGIDGEVVVLGSEGRFEIWNPERFDTVMDDDNGVSLSELKTD